MVEKVLSQAAKRALAILGKKQIFREEAYLAGGTAIALYLGHRYSYDLDFFTPKKFNAGELRRYLRKNIPQFRVEREAAGTILGFIGDFRFSIFFYDYPLLFKPFPFLSIRIADLRDLAAMKIDAISDRGKKRDFVDLYFLLQKGSITLYEALIFYEQKYKKLSQNITHIIKSLTYFEDAEEELHMPDMIEKATWNEVRKFFETAVPKTAKLFWPSSRQRGH